MTLKLKSITAEEKACRAAWAAMPKAKYAVHLHHEIVAERLTEPIENRIAYILSDKPKDEQALRLRLMRPVAAAAWAEYSKVTAAARAEYDKVTAPARAEYNKVTAPARAEYNKVAAAARAEYDKVVAAAHQAICPTPDCPFADGSIFGGAK